MVPTQEPATVAEAKGNAEDSLRTPATRSPSAVGAEETNVVLAEELTTAKKYRPGFKTTVAVKLAFCGAVVPDWAVLPVEASQLPSASNTPMSRLPVAVAPFIQMAPEYARPMTLASGPVTTNG